MILLSAHTSEALEVDLTGHRCQALPQPPAAVPGRLELEEEIEQSPFVKMSPPAVPEQAVPLLTNEEIGRLLQVCKGNDFESRRDTAIIRLLLDSGLRVAELIGIKLQHLDFEQDVALGHGQGPAATCSPIRQSHRRGTPALLAGSIQNIP